MSISPVNDDQMPLFERYIERAALIVLEGSTFIECLKLNGIAPAIQVCSPKGKAITIRGSDVSDSRTWRKFWTSTGQRASSYPFVELGKSLTRQFYDWLQSDHTERYRFLSSEDEIAWLKRVVELAVIYHIMEQKYQVCITGQGQGTFADPDVAREMGRRKMVNDFSRAAARMVHHKIKEPDQAEQMIAQVYEEQSRRYQSNPLQPFEPLPPLPLGSTLPFALLEQTTGEHDGRFE